MVMEKKLEQMFKGKKILVTGGTGCIGSEIVKRLAAYRPNVIRIFSNDEDNTYRMMNELGQGQEKMIHELGNKRFLIGDIRDKERVMLAMEGIDIVYHAAALKHVPLCEYNPFEAIQTNVLGTQNVIEAALVNGVAPIVDDHRVLDKRLVSRQVAFAEEGAGGYVPRLKFVGNIALVKTVPGRGELFFTGAGGVFLCFDELAKRDGQSGVPVAFRGVQNGQRRPGDVRE